MHDLIELIIKLEILCNFIFFLNHNKTKSKYFIKLCIMSVCLVMIRYIFKLCVCVCGEGEGKCYLASNII